MIGPNSLTVTGVTNHTPIRTRATGFTNFTSAGRCCDTWKGKNGSGGYGGGVARPINNSLVALMFLDLVFIHKTTMSIVLFSLGSFCFSLLIETHYVSECSH